jgi:hypothetical protein
MVKFDKSAQGRWHLIPRGRDGEVVTIDVPAQFVW